MESLGLDIKLLLAQIINFGILFVVLKKLLYKPLMKMLDDRNKKINQAVTDSEEIQKRLTALESKEEELIQKAKTKGENERKEIVESAKKEKDLIIDEAKMSAQKELEKGLLRIKSAQEEAVNTITDGFIDKLVQEVVKKISKSKLVK